MKGDAKTKMVETTVVLSAKELNISYGPKINFIQKSSFDVFKNK